MDANANNEVSTAVDRLLSGTVDKLNAKAQETENAHTEALAKLKAQVQGQAKAHAERVANVNVSTKIDALLADALAKQKNRLETELAKTVAKVKAQAERKAKKYTDEIAKVKADAEQTIAEKNARTHAEAEQAKAEAEETIARIKEEAERTISEEKSKAHAEAEQAKAEAEETIARIKEEAERTISEEKSKAHAEAEQAKAEAEEKAKTFVDTANKIRSEAEQTIQDVRAEAEKTIAGVKVEARHAVAKVRAQTRSNTVAGGAVPGQPVTAVGEAQGQPVSQAIARMSQSTASLPGQTHIPQPGEYAGGLSGMCARDIMQKETVWANPDDTVQQALDKMQQSQTSYLMVGQNNMLEGIVSKSDLAGAVSPYLRPMFAKWRRPLDDATLQIRIKWIMSKPVHTIRPDTPVLTIMNHMRQFNVLCLPVVDAQGKVHGVVAEANIFKMLLKLKNSAKSPASPDATAQRAHQPQTASV